MILRPHQFSTSVVSESVPKTRLSGDRVFLAVPLTEGARSNYKISAAIKTFSNELLLLAHKTSVQISAYFSQNHCV